VAAVTEENEELYDDGTNDDTEYYDEDWMDWTGALTVGTSGVMVLTMTGHSWTGMMTQTGVTLVGLSSAAASSTSFTGPGVQSGQTAPTWKLVKQ